MSSEIAELRWLWPELVEDIHEFSLQEWGGAEGLREPSQLHANLGRPQHMFHFGGEARVAALAAWYVVASARTQCFVDGNKRTGLLCGLASLDINGYRFASDRDEIWKSVVALSEGSLDEKGFVAWFVSLVELV